MGQAGSVRPCTSPKGHLLQPNVAGEAHFVCLRCWQRFVCPGYAPGLERWFPVYQCHRHRSLLV
jgi:hypothetical protein